MKTSGKSKTTHMKHFQKSHLGKNAQEKSPVVPMMPKIPRGR